jgi:hypothetical protein
LGIVKRLSHPDELLQLKPNRFITTGRCKQAARIDRNHAEAVGFAQIVELIHCDQTAGPRLVDDIDARLTRYVTLKMARDMPGSDVVAAAGG